MNYVMKPVKKALVVGVQCVKLCSAVMTLSMYGFTMLCDEMEKKLTKKN